MEDRPRYGTCHHPFTPLACAHTTSEHWSTHPCLMLCAYVSVYWCLKIYNEIKEGVLSPTDWIIYSALDLKVHEPGVGTRHWHFVKPTAPEGLCMRAVHSSKLCAGTSRKESVVSRSLGLLLPVVNSEFTEVRSELVRSFGNWIFTREIPSV